ncbi:MAG: DoxX family protein [Minisyncoccia bacterium]
MLNPFPELLTYSLIGPFILRVVLGVIIAETGFLKFRKERQQWIASFEALHLKPADIIVSVLGLIEIVGAVGLILGLYTQIAALVFVVVYGIELYAEYKEEQVLKRDIVFYLLMFTIALSLLLTGAGAFAYDIPL